MKKIILLLISFFVLASCDEDEEVFSPKPRGYMRLEFPEKKYMNYDSTCPFAFQIPVYSFIKKDEYAGADPCWLNIEFPKFKATLHLSYKVVNNDLEKYLKDSHEFANKHQVKATGVDEIVIVRDTAKVYGLLFDIGGNTASSIQFYLTDSTKHFIRGALYLNSVPNIDSSKIVVDFIKKDVLHLINTARWKN